jgi:hypothetical protein
MCPLMRTSRIDVIYYYNTKTAHTSNLKFRKAPPHVYKAPGAPMARELLAVMNPESTSSHVISYLRSTELKSVFLRLAIFPFRQLVPDGVFLLIFENWSFSSRWNRSDDVKQPVST